MTVFDYSKFKDIDPLLADNLENYLSDTILCNHNFKLSHVCATSLVAGKLYRSLHKVDKFSQEDIDNLNNAISENEFKKRLVIMANKYKNELQTLKNITYTFSRGHG